MFATGTGGKEPIKKSAERVYNVYLHKIIHVILAHRQLRRGARSLCAHFMRKRRTRRTRKTNLCARATYSGTLGLGNTPQTERKPGDDGTYERPRVLGEFSTRT